MINHLLINYVDRNLDSSKHLLVGIESRQLVHHFDIAESLDVLEAVAELIEAVLVRLPLLKQPPIVLQRQ